LGSAALVACAQPPVWEQPPPPVKDAPVVQPGALHRAELENGLRILVLEDHRLPRVAFSLTLRHGEASLPVEQAGLLSLTADLLERGAGARDSLALASATDELGASLATGAGWDSIGVAVAGLSRDEATLLAILADVVLRPRLDPREAQRARSERLAQLEGAKDDPATLLGWSAAAALYPGHRFGAPADGTPKSVAGFDARVARSLHGRFFVPNDAVIAVVGDVQTQDVVAKIRSAFGAWPRGPLPAAGEPPPPQVPPARRVIIVDQPDLVQARVLIAHEGIARGDPDRVPAGLLNSVFGGSGFSSRLMASVRSEAGLTYSVGSGFSLRRAPGPFVISTFTRVPEVRRMLDLLLGELARVRSEPPSKAELASARTLAVGEFALGLETSGEVMASLVDLDVYGLPEDSLDTYRARVRATTREQTAALAQRLFHPERALIVLVGPAKELEPQLAGLGPVEVVKP
jgi:predicted Zn-dependent peptidase